MFRNYNGSTANQIWLKILKDLKKPELATVKSSRIGKVREILHSTISLSNPRNRWVLAKNPPINPAFAIAEVVWIMNGREDAEFLNYWNRKLPQFAGSDKNYNGAYGFRLKKHFGIDQLELAFETLKYNPDSRQVVLQLWDPLKDLPKIKGMPNNADIPCNINSLLKVKDKKLEWMQVIRSNDFFLGLPYNFIQFTTLQEIFAGWLGVKVGTYNQLSDSLHLYLNNVEDVNNSKNKKTLINNDDLSIPKGLSEKLLKEINDKMESIIYENFNKEKIFKIAMWKKAPKSYINLLLVVLAEAARKEKLFKISKDLISNCSNPILVQVWKNWISNKNMKIDK